MTPTILIAVAIVAALGHAQPSFAQRGSIAGVVTSAGGTPVARAVVKRVDEPPSTAPPGCQVAVGATPSVEITVVTQFN